MGFETKGHTHRGSYPFRGKESAFASLDIRKNYPKLVASDAGHTIRLPRNRADPPASLANGGIAGAMSVGIVDDLQAVHVEIENAELLGLSASRSQPSLKLVIKQSAVCQTGQRIVGRAMIERLRGIAGGVKHRGSNQLTHQFENAN